MKLGLMKHLFSIVAFVVFLASSNVNVNAGTSCREHYYQTECEADDACKWESSKNKAICKTKQASTGCPSHSEFYCEANGCQWNPTKRKCEDKAKGE